MEKIIKHPLVQQIKDFLSTNFAEGKALLLGYSGGLDSTALLSLLIECKAFFPLDIRVAHFDHGWREESAREAQEIKEKITQLGLPFYTQRSENIQWKEIANKEEVARNLRYEFFQKVYQEVNAQALLLAHQREDAAETVLKRLFEGANLFSLGGMQEVGKYEEIVVWRPCLGISRKKLEEWNRSKNIPFFLDSTNEDLSFLRPRLRYKVFPYLEQWFGKAIQKNIAHLGQEFDFLKQYLEQKIEPLLADVVEGDLGFALLHDKIGSLHPLERRELLRLCLQKRGVVISRDNLRQAELLYQEGGYDKRVDVSKGELIIDGKNIIWIQMSLYTFNSSIGNRCSFSSLLEGALQGMCAYVVESKEVDVIPYDRLEKKQKERLSSFFARNKIPGRMRGFFPCIKKEGFEVYFPLLQINEETPFIEENKYILMINFKNIQN